MKQLEFSNSEKPLPPLGLEGQQEEVIFPESTSQSYLVGNGTMEEATRKDPGPLKEELEPQKRLSCCQRQQRKKRERMRSTLSPPLLQPSSLALVRPIG